MSEIIEGPDAKAQYICITCEFNIGEEKKDD